MGDLHVDGAPVVDASVWAVGPRGQMRRLLDADDVARLEADHRAWDHVVFVGPAGASADEARDARRVVASLVRDAGPALAHGGVALDGGWRTTYADARTAAGSAVVLPDRRDALLASLRRVGVAGAAALGPRSSVLAGLLGSRATHRVGRALSAAVADGRWDAVTLAVAASDLVGPERIEEILVLDEPAPLAPEAWSAIVAAEHLADVLAPYTEPRRFTLLKTLWDEVAANAIAAAAIEQRRSYLPRLRREGAQEAIRSQREASADADLVAAARIGPTEPRPFQLFALHPTNVLWNWLEAAIGEVVCSTVLLRLAVADRDGHLVDAVLEAAPVLEYLAGCRDPFPNASRPAASAWQNVANLWVALRVATRPSGKPGGVAGVRVSIGDPAAAFRHFLRGALDLAEAAWEDVARLLGFADRNIYDWSTAELPFLGLGFREALPADPSLVAGWRQRVLLHNPLGGELPSAPSGLLADGGRPEHVLDGVWLAELVAVMAELHGEDRWEVEIAGGNPTHALGGPVGAERDDDPLRPRAESLPAAIASTAQLIRLGAEPPERPRRWNHLADQLYRALDVESWLSGEFRVPRSFREASGTSLPGTAFVIRVAEDAHTLASWGRFMGNCIATYAEDGRKGRSVLIGLYDGPVLAHNLELRRRGNRWWAEELLARFNEDSPPEIHEAVDRWLAELAEAEAARLASGSTRLRPPGGGVRTGRRPTRRPSRVQVAAAEENLRAATAAALASAGEARHGCDRVATGLGAGGPGGIGRARVPALSDAVIQVAGTAVAAAELAALLAAEPIADAIAVLTPSDRAALAGLERLAAAAAPGARGVQVPRRLLRIPEVRAGLVLARARNRCGRALLGLLVAGAEHVGAIASVQRDLGCGLILAHQTLHGDHGREVEVTIAPDGTVPGYPPSHLLADGVPWGPAWRAAAAISWERIPPYRARVESDLAAGFDVTLLVPTDWMGRGGWPAWWRRVHR